MSQGDDCITGCLLDYPYFKKYSKLIAIDYYKKYYNFTWDLDRAEGSAMFFIIEEAK